MKKIFNISLGLILLTGIILLLSFAVKDHKNVSCIQVNIAFNDNARAHFINTNDVEQIIYKKCDTLVGQLLDSINTSEIQDILIQNPYIKKVAVFKSMKGEIQIDIERNIPLVRIINKQNKSFYLSNNGSVLPFSKHFTPLVMVATGNINEDYQSIKSATFYPGEQNILSSILQLSQALAEHESLNSYIEQIYVNKEGEIELVPADGNHYIILGDVDELQIKLRNLMAFYREGKPKMKDPFTSINLKFTNQVVCKK
ncbi:MAG: hypothetical protein K9H16_07955 [Bacteroidales bacterium]|nr:hypothetical protein [Bacteroidales bacterium]